MTSKGRGSPKPAPASKAAAPPPAPEPPTAPADLDSEGFRRIRSRTLERRILATGVLLLLLVAAEASFVTWVDRDAGYALWRGILTENVLGREAGIPVALEGGSPAWLVAQVSFAQDVGVVCLAYPAFLWALHRYHDRDNMLMRRLRRIQTQALARKAYTRRWGPLGVFLFMLVPFLINGPLVGAIAGRVAGVRTKFLILPVLGATAVAAAAWTYAYDAVFAAVGGIDPRIPPLATASIVAVLLLWSLIGEWRERRAQAAAAAASTEGAKGPGSA